MVFGFAYVYNMLPSIWGSSNDPKQDSSNIPSNLKVNITDEVLQNTKNNLRKTGLVSFEPFEKSIFSEDQISAEPVNEEVLETTLETILETSLFPGRNAPSNISQILKGEFKPHDRMVRVITVSKETICETINKLRPTKINEHPPISSKNVLLKELDAAFANGISNFLNKRRYDLN